LHTGRLLREQRCAIWPERACLAAFAQLRFMPTGFAELLETIRLHKTLARNSSDERLEQATKGMR
jgi:hypothetical protein